MGTRGVRRPQINVQAIEEPRLIVDVNDIIKDAKEKGYISNFITKIEAIVKSNNINVEYSYDLPSSVSGKLECVNNKWTIIVNAHHHPNRRRFTMAHELAHYFLHKDSSLSFEDTTFFRDDAYTPIEFAANEFASQLLMPDDDVRKCIKVGITSLNQLSNVFHVSVDAMRNRIKMLGYNTKPSE